MSRIESRFSTTIAPPAAPVGTSLAVSGLAAPGGTGENTGFERRLRTSAELRDIIGKPLLPCPDCGAIAFALLQTGELLCLGCNGANHATIDSAKLAFYVLSVPGRPYEPDTPRVAREWRCRIVEHGEPGWGEIVRQFERGAPIRNIA